MDINSIIMSINNVVWGWPLLLFIVGTAIFTTFYLSGVQFRYFVRSWKLVFVSEETVHDGEHDMTTFQAFLNVLSASLGNGSIAGIATAVYAGGPGVAFWVFVIGLLTMSVRFAEVYLSSRFATQSAIGSSLGGPMIYLQHVPGGRFLPALYALFCLLLSLSGGNAMQANSVRVGLTHILPIPNMVVALLLFAFILYVMLGGAPRIIKASDRIVPIKVGVFFVSSIIILLYHYKSLIPALHIIYQGAFTPQALAGAAVLFSAQHALRFGISRGLNASEAGLGTAGILYGGASSKKPVENGLQSMISAFISANIVCFSFALMIVASGVWNNGLTSTALTSSAFETVFGQLGGWIVIFLSVSFGMGTVVSYAYIARACWVYLTGGRFIPVFTALFCSVTFLGALAKVEAVWNATDLVNAGLLLSNLFGILYLLPRIKAGLTEYRMRHG